MIRWTLSALLAASVVCASLVANATDAESMAHCAANGYSHTECLTEIWAFEIEASCTERAELLWSVAEAAELDADAVYEDSFAACMKEEL